MTLSRAFALVLVSCAALLAGMTSGSAHAATIGTLAQATSPAGCITDASAPINGCGTARALLGPSAFFGSHALALSRDGKNLYVANFNSNSVAVFDRNRINGVLTQKADSAGCIMLEPTSGCGRGRGLIKPVSVAVSNDGKSVYVASIVGSTVTVFDRNLATGTLTQKAGTSGCVSNQPLPECALGRGLGGANAVAVSPDNKNFYVASFTGAAVAAFDRNTANGTISQKAGPDGCFSDPQAGDCRAGRALKGAEGLTISPDGKSVYIGAAVSNGVAVFRRDRSNGRLQQPPDRAGCVTESGHSSCASGQGLVGAEALEVSPDNKNLYVASGIGDSVASFDRNRTNGQIQQLDGEAGCYSNLQRNPRCVAGVQLDAPEGIAISPDGDSVYVGSFDSNAVAIFDRVSYTGTITQRSGVNGCVTNVPTSGCTTGKALGSANGMTISRDGRSLYVGAYSSNAVNTFNRAQPPSGSVATRVPSKIVVAPRTSIAIPVTCSGMQSRRCPGRLTLRAAAGTIGAGTSGLVTIGRNSFNMRTRKSEPVGITISARAARSLRSNGSLPVVTVMSVVEPSGRIATFRQSVRLSVVDGLG